MDDSTSNQDRHEEVRSAIDEWKERIHEKNPSLKIPSNEDIIEYLSVENPESRDFWENQTLQAWKTPLDKVVKAASLGIWSSIKNSLNSAYSDPDERYLPAQEDEALSPEINDSDVDYSEPIGPKGSFGTEEPHRLPVDGSRHGGRHMATYEQSDPEPPTPRDVEHAAAIMDYGEEEFDELDLFEEVREVPGGGAKTNSVR